MAAYETSAIANWTFSKTRQTIRARVLQWIAV